MRSSRPSAVGHRLFGGLLLLASVGPAAALSVVPGPASDRVAAHCSVADAAGPSLQRPSNCAAAASGMAGAPAQDAPVLARSPAATTEVPEPESYMLMLAGMAAVGFVALRRR